LNKEKRLLAHADVPLLLEILCRNFTIRIAHIAEISPQ
jgi:hypothetical protein